MWLRSSGRQRLARAGRDVTTNEAALLILTGLLLLLAGFGTAKFLLNFDQLQRLAEEFKPAARLQVKPFETESGDKTNVAPPAEARVAFDQAQLAPWLVPLNRYREMVGLPPLTADAELSRGDLLHSHYLVINYGFQLPGLDLGADAHTEDPAKPGFTGEGAAAAAASDIDWSWSPRSRRQPAWAIDDWMQGPFHRMQIINPYLHTVGYGSDCHGAACFAALNTGSFRAPSTPQLWSRPVAFPPDGSVIHMATSSSEWPNPLTGCHGYVLPAGLPITLELGHLLVPELTSFSLKKGDGADPVEACAYNAATYVNPDAVAQNAARAVLKDFGAIVLVPRYPLQPGRYVVSITAGRTYSWSFSLSPAGE